MKDLDLIGKEKIVCVNIARVCNKTQTSTHGKEKEIFASFAVIPATAEVIATVHGKCFIERETQLNWWRCVWERFVCVHLLWCYLRLQTSTGMYRPQIRKNPP